MKKGLVFFLVGVMLCSLVACSSVSGGQTPGQTTTTATAPEQAGKILNALTGNYDIKQGDATRPVAIMVPNDSAIIGHQIGIDKADFYLECETEGAIPRLMTAFANASRIPKTYGPVRSARSPFVTTANELGFVYTYSGMAAHVKARIARYNLETLYAGTIGAPTFWRDKALGQKVNNWSNLVTGGEKLSSYLKKTDYSTAKIKELPFKFGEKAGDTAATTIQVSTTPSHRATFIYDSTTGLYGKNIGNIDACKPHKTEAGDQIKVSNVLVLYAPKFIETKDSRYTWYDFELGKGEGYLFSGGTYRKVGYNRTETSLSLTEADGSPLLFTKGKIYMVLADKASEDKQVVQ